ncbi:hypothetical protein PWT90_07435 [Aphanocladium album]|nr:hypothetical protein PWT90_07435 [Aphanocladium album]
MEILASVREQALTADEVSRKAIIDQLNHLARELETPQDCMQRILYQPITLPVVRAGCDLGLFNHIVDSVQPLSSAALADRCGASPLLLGRLLRYMASVDVVREVAPDTYSATTTTRTLASRDWQSAVFHNFDVITPCITAMPDFLKEHGYQDSENPTDCAFNRGHKTDQQCFAWYPSRPEMFAHFNRFMRVHLVGMPPALPARVRGRVVVQDHQPELIERQALRCDGVEHMVHDFFTPQPVRGARMYYMRNIMHDWRDQDAAVILRHVREAMDANRSVLLIDDMVLPNSGTHWHAAQLDIVMMAALAARERTMRQWEELVPRAGLRIREVFRYTESLGDSIIECVRDDDEEEEEEEEDAE